MGKLHFGIGGFKGRQSYVRVGRKGKVFGISVKRGGRIKGTGRGYSNVLCGKG